ncbi:unnamed protein product [Tenebrio molitor]|nr:unnamed protein product [Tenebrio molitor]
MTLRKKLKKGKNQVVTTRLGQTTLNRHQDHRSVKRMLKEIL